MTHTWRVEPMHTCGVYGVQGYEVVRFCGLRTEWAGKFRNEKLERAKETAERLAEALNRNSIE